MDLQNWYFFGQKNGDWWKVEQTSPVDYLDVETHPHICKWLIASDVYHQFCSVKTLKLIG